jgi:dTDP-4-dehydrorhamnose reductase
MTILVTGGNGQLASALAEQGGARVHRVGRPDLDFDQLETVDAVFRAAAPDLVVNAAAYTAVDAAEAGAEAAYRANRDGPGRLAALCAEAGVPLIHISTDYVFDGMKGAPYLESDPVSPQGVYGASKLAGEQAVMETPAQTVILRTSWVYAPRGKNFVRTMLGAARKTNKLRVVADQKGCPTTAEDLAAAVLSVAERLAQGWQPDYRGIFHAAGSGWTTWHGLAVAVFDEAARYGAPVPEVAAIATADWPTPARRPPDSRLDCTRLSDVFGVRLPDWRDALRRTIDAIFRDGTL